ncbi:hypothetical protein DL95DRAFT_471934 [Leptodontidium sp. 2 PMI_412]|nr:hypothetical protein DL95DRAFT_471934 [Leptodontidium sp. 2 PMI_412]
MPVPVPGTTFSDCYPSRYMTKSGYSLANPTISVPTDRPAFSGTCYTDIPSGSSVQVTAYGSSGVTATISFTAAATTSTPVYAYPIDGYAFGVAAQ